MKKRGTAIGRLGQSLLLSLAMLTTPLTVPSRPAPQGMRRTSGIYAPALSSRVEALLDRMTIEEKVGQLVQYSEGQTLPSGGAAIDYEDMITHGEIGALLNFTTAAETNALQRVAVVRSRLGIPILFGLDVVHGFHTMFPIPLGLASTWDPGLVEHAARVAAQEASASGIRLTFSPMVDIARDARWGRIAEGAGEDPFLGALVAAAYVRGYQGPRLDIPGSIAACAKHFVGYGAAEGGRDYNTTEISEHTLRESYLPPFLAAINAGAASVMSAFTALNGVPASSNAFTLTHVLRHEWRFRGLVDSDWGSIAQLVVHGVATDAAVAARKAFLAGVDMDMAGNVYHEHLANLVRTGYVPLAKLDESVRRVLRVKFALGLFDHPYVDPSEEARAVSSREALALARSAAERSFVLLKNEHFAAVGSILPIANNSRIALVGPMIDYPSAQDSLRSALIARVGRDNVSVARGSGVSDGTDADISAAVLAASSAGVVILVLGESADMSGEAASRATLTLPGRQQELLEKIVALGRPTILILYSGRPLTLAWAFEHVSAVIAAWLPGMQAGPALVRTLFGDFNPSGRLVVTWPRTVGQVPIYYNRLNTGSPLRLDGLSESRFTSRYIDSVNSPQFPFGFGLSYTAFTYYPLELSVRRLSAAAMKVALEATDSAVLIATAELTNGGDVPGDTTAQLYVHLEGTSTAQPVRALRGFQRISLAAGESRMAVFKVPASAFAIWDIDNHYTVEPAKATLWISQDSASGIGVPIEIGP